ncbi:hypothetical protein JB92DRAFT_2835996 [Gautieria morchelliformis]|nr:hypothetical protein JB92DRAFT_2835996 [Gautieria morchelliformis]
MPRSGRGRSYLVGYASRVHIFAARTTSAPCFIAQSGLHRGSGLLQVYSMQPERNRGSIAVASVVYAPWPSPMPSMELGELAIRFGLCGSQTYGAMVGTLALGWFLQLKHAHNVQTSRFSSFSNSALMIIRRWQLKATGIRQPTTDTSVMELFKNFEDDLGIDGVGAGDHRLVAAAAELSGWCPQTKFKAEFANSWEVDNPPFQPRADVNQVFPRLLLYVTHQTLQELSAPSPTRANWESG